MVEQKLTSNHPLFPYLYLYDKNTMLPITDPCFREYEMTFVCTHKKAMFKRDYKMEDQYCSVCKAMRQVKTFEFVGVKPEDLDYDRQESILIQMKEWDCIAKSGLYYLMKKKKMPNGKYIAQVDYDAAPNYGLFTESEKEAKEEKSADIATAAYADQKAVTVFEVPEYALNVPEVVELLKQYLPMLDVKAFRMTVRNQKGDGTYNYDKGPELIASELKIPQQKTV